MPLTPREQRADDLVLEVEGGLRVAGWLEVELFRSIEAAAGTFRLSTVTERPLRVRDGDAVTVRLAGEVLLRGHVDDVEVTIDERGSRLELAGRDLAGDLVDCSSVHDPSEWADVPFAVLVAELAEPFGIEVRFEGGAANAAPFALFRLQTGETAYSAIERACRLRGFLAFPAGDGALIIARPGRDLARAEIVEGRNMRRARLSRSARGRFQTYLVRGQSPGGDDFYGEQAAHAEGSASDPGIQRFRPLLVLAEGPVTFESARDRAQWEASVRAARAAGVVATVLGWRQVPNGPPWTLNELSRVLVPTVGLDKLLLVSSVRFVRDDQGDRTDVGLTRRSAYTPAPEVDEEEELEWGEED